MSSSPEAIVRAFFQEMGSGNGLFSSIERYCAPECSWENTGLPTANNRQEMLAMMQGFVDGYGLTAVVVDFVAISTGGDTVLTERVDHLDASAGKRLMSLRLAGALVVRDGKIVRWSDYFDPRPFLPPA